MAIEIPKLTNGGRLRDKHLTGLHWAHGSLDEQPVVNFRCLCGGVSALSESHTIHADGRVEPSVWHDEAACGFHEYVTLKDYEELR